MPKTKTDTKNLQTWVNPEVHAAVAAKAAANPRSVSSYLRNLIYKDLGLSTDNPCEACNGSGRKRDASGITVASVPAVWVPCEECGGSGRR